MLLSQKEPCFQSSLVLGCWIKVPRVKGISTVVIKVEFQLRWLWELPWALLEHTSRYVWLGHTGIALGSVTFNPWCSGTVPLFCFLAAKN